MLFQGESILFEEDKIKDMEKDDSKINEKYVLGEVRIVTEQARYPLDTINMMIDSGNYELNPDFQRRRRWDVQKKSKLIESFIMNVPIPPIFLYENEFSHYEVMDGLQRMTTIYDFYSDKFKLCGLQLWPELNDRNYSTLPEKIKKGIDRRYISSIILLQESAKSEDKAREMKQLVFERINSGGVKLEAQETRNALYNGKMNDLCLELSRNNYLCKLLNIPLENIQYTLSDEFDQNDLDNNARYKKMEDVEYVLRFFAMRQLNGYINSLSQFLDFYLNKANGFDDYVLNSLKMLFEDTIKLAYDIFDEEAFYMWRKRTGKGVNRESWNWFSRATTTIYDPLMQSLANVLPYKQKLLESKSQIKTDIIKFYQENYEVFEGRSNNRSDIEKRIEKFKEFFSAYIEE